VRRDEGGAIEAEFAGRPRVGPDARSPADRSALRLGARAAARAARRPGQAIRHKLERDELPYAPD